MTLQSKYNANTQKKSNLQRKKKIISEDGPSHEIVVDSFSLKKKKLDFSKSFPQKFKQHTVPRIVILNEKEKDRDRINRLQSPYTKFSLWPSNKLKHREVPYDYKRGLTSKEKNYLLCSCQSRFSEYTVLKNLAKDAIKKRKVFLMFSNCKPIRDELVARGWVEKILPERMDLTKIRRRPCIDNSKNTKDLDRIMLASFVEKCVPSFVWNAKENFNIERTPGMSQRIIHNRLKNYALWTSKQGLCSSMKSNHWNYIEDVAEINTPRTYVSFDAGEKEEFEEDYKLTACTSLLKWILSMVANDRPVCNSSGKIGMNVIVFALNRCKEFLFLKQNKDIDKSSEFTVTNGQWKSFLRKYFMIISREEYFIMDKDNKMPLYLGYAKFLLKEIHKYRPQLSCEGCHNIWIIKPAHCSRGRGIRMASTLGVITDLFRKNKYVCQKYIEEPLLIHDTKFDIRQYYLISRTYPLVIWMYKDCYLKFSSQKYSLKDFHESIHLTNYAVQKNYKNCGDRHEELPQNNMWHLNTYKEYLSKLGKGDVWDTIIYPGMKKSIVGTMLSCQDAIPNVENRFELYGCDFILDKDYKPWLIEINSSPDLNPTTNVTATICPAVLSDTIKVVIDRASDIKAPTGQFECIYRQTITTHHYGTTNELVVRGFALPLDYFYRGNVNIGNSKTILNVEKEQDINSILQKLKAINVRDIMFEPDNDFVLPQEEVEEEDETENPKNTSSEEYLNSVANIITEQLDTLLDRIYSDEGSSRKYKRGKLSVSSTSSLTFASGTSKQAGKNVIILPETLINPLARSVSTIETSSKDTFYFNHVDDRICGKASSMIHLAKIGSNTKAVDSLIRVTTNIFNFLDAKEKEYCY